MNIEHARLIVAAAEETGIEAELREDYSGRGMYGRKTAGVVMSGMAFAQMAA